MTVILGGGISGLSAAYYALTNPKLGEITLLEASNRFGGWIRTHRSPNGIIFEKGPRTIRAGATATKNTLDLIDNLQLTEKIIPISSLHPAAKNRFVYVDKKLHTLPSTFGGLFRTKSPFRRPLITTLWTDYKAPQEIKEDESIYSFAERRLGKDIADYMISPLVCGVCAGDAKKISVNTLMSTLFQAEQKHGTILKGIVNNIRDKNKNVNKVSEIHKTPSKTMSITSANRCVGEKWSVYSFENGLEELPKKLAEHLSTRQVNINLNKCCNNITFKSDCVELEVNGEIKKCSRIISSLPAKKLASLIQHQHPELATELEAIPTVSVGVINFHFRRNIFPIEGFGFLIPPSEKLPILGVTFDSCIFPQGPSSVLTVMMGGAWFEHYFGQNPTEEYLLSIALENLKTILNIKDDPLDVDVSILRDCIPQYHVGHNQRVDRIHKYISSNGIPLALCGSSYQGISINEVILSAKNAIDNIS